MVAFVAGRMPPLAPNFPSALARLGVVVVEYDAEVAFGGDREYAIGHHMRAPKVAVRVERDAVDERSVVRRPEDLPLAQRSVRGDPETRDEGSACFHGVEPLLASIEPDLVRERQPVGDDAQRPFVV